MLMLLVELDALKKEWIDYFVFLDGLCCHDIRHKIKINHLVSEIEISDLELFLRVLKSDNVKELRFKSPRLFYERESNRVDNEEKSKLTIYNSSKFSRLVLSLDPDYKFEIVNECEEQLYSKIDKDRYPSNREFYLKVAGLTGH